MESGPSRIETKGQDVIAERGCGVAAPLTEIPPTPQHTHRTALLTTQIVDPEQMFRPAYALTLSGKEFLVFTKLNANSGL